jgi:hypothetical protein
MGLILTINGENWEMDDDQLMGKEKFDFDGDGWPEVITSVGDTLSTIRVRSLGGAILWEYSPTKAEICPTCPATPATWPVGFGELDPTAGRELVLGYYYYEGMDYYTGVAVVSTSLGEVLYNFPDAYCNGVVDFDGDGNQELVLYYYQDPGISWLEIRGYCEASIPDTASHSTSHGVRSISAGPCPSSGSVVLHIDSSVKARARVMIHDVTGRLVRDLGLVPVGPGRNQVTWDGRASNGNRVASGEYYFNIRLGGTKETCKAVVVR